MRPQMSVEFLVVIQPPESRVCKDDEIRAGALESFQFGYSRFVVRRWPPVLTTFFQEWDDVAAGKNLGAPLSLIDQNDRLAGLDQRAEILDGAVKLWRLILDRVQSKRRLQDTMNVLVSEPDVL